MQQALKAFESAPGLIRSATDWERHLGGDYQIVKPFLRLRKGLATSVPCPAKPPCGCDHAVIEHGRDDIVSVCRCDPKVCPPTKVKREDVLIYELNVASFGNTIADTLNIKSEDKTVEELSATRMIGIFSPNPTIKIPIFLTIQWDATAFRHTVECLVAKAQSPFVLLAPTDCLCTNELSQLLRQHQARFLAFDTMLAWENKFICKMPLVELLSEFIEQLVPARDTYSFCKEGKTWTLVFQGTPKTVSDCKGMGHIAVLLSAPNREIHCMQLYNGLSLPSSTSVLDSDSMMEMSPERESSPRLRDGEKIAIEATIDKTGLAQYRTRLEELKEKISEAEELGNTDNLAHLKQEEDTLTKEIARVLGYGGKARKEGPTKKARQAVSKAIEVALAQIKKIHPAGGKYLDSTIRRGEFLIYQPQDGIDWAVKC